MSADRSLHCRSVVTAFVLPALLALATALAHAAPKAVKASYNAYMNGMQIGTIQEQFEVDGSSYRLVSDTKTMGLATLLNRGPVKFVSTGQVTADGLRPTSFEGRRTNEEAPQLAARFDWAQGQVALTNKGKTQSVPLPPGTQDRLSVMYQLMFLPVARMKLIDLPVADGRKLDRYRYRVTPDVEIDTPMGRMKTLHLVKQREAGRSSAEVWVSTEHDYFPVKLVIIQKDGMRYEQTIQSLEIRH